MRRLLSGLLHLPGIAVVMVSLFGPVARAQGYHEDENRHAWPDTLEMTTVTGTVLVDVSTAHPLYFLDTDGDENADYHLAFGPWWFEPVSGAVRPSQGETVTLVGLVQDDALLPVLVVFEIDGLSWREAVSYGRHGWRGEPFWPGRGDTLTVAGVMMVDTTYYYSHYYLDVDGDGEPEYQLGLGPDWYMPASGAGRPADGDVLTVWGGLHERHGVDMLSVYTLNGLTWRSPDGPAPWAGTWIPRDHDGITYAYCLTDSANWVAFAPGHMGSHMGGGRSWPDSSFVQFWDIHPDSLPGPNQPNRFRGFYLDLHDPQGGRMMNAPFGGHHGSARFEKELRFQFSYDEDELTLHGLSEAGMVMQYWDEEAGHWTEHHGAEIDVQHNTITFSSLDLQSYYALSASSTVTGIADDALQPRGYVLSQNYPNPFNPVTSITYTLPQAERVLLGVYDLLGREVARLVDSVQAAGNHVIVFDARELASGVYLYRMKTAGFTEVKRLVLLR